MPRKGSARRKNAPGGGSAKSVATPRMLSRTVIKDEDETSQDAERSRRSSTVAQTAASVAESRVTRSRNPKREIASPARESKAVETSASRARSSRRSTQNVNYKESDGEEEVPTSKNEDDFESNEEFDDSDSDEKSKKKSRKVKSQKGRSTKPRTRAAPKTGRRSRSSRKKKDSEEEEEEEEETVELSDESDNDKDQSRSSKGVESKKGVSSTPDRRKSRNAAQPPVVDVEDSEENSGRRSRRTSAKSISVEPASKRPSRNKQVKKYTEVDEEDFSEPKSEGEYEPEGKKESSRKRKRDSEIESNKRAKQDQSVADSEIKHADNDVEKSSKEDVKCPGNKAADEVDDLSSDEPMEIDESVSDDLKSQNEESKQSLSASAEENMKTDDPIKESTKSETNESSQSKKSVPVEIEPKEQDEKDTLEKKKEITDDLPLVPETSKSDDAKRDEKSHSDSIKSAGGEEAELKASPITEPCQQETKKHDQKSENVISPQLHDDTFLSKELVPPATPVNGEDNRNMIDAAAPKDVVPHKPESLGFDNQNDAVPKTNGAQDEIDDKRTLAKDALCALPNRKYVFNRYISEDLRLSLKEGTFGIMSYNLSSGFTNADKLIRELDKLQASIICLQEVSQSFFTETLQSKLDILGYKAVTNSPWSDSGLVTFYKTSLFRLCNVVDIPTQSLISQALEGSDLEESEKQAVSGCYDKCGNVLITQLASVLGSHAVTVANVKIPQCSLSLNALQVCCVVRKISTLREHIRPVLICGEFNSCETEVPYQLVRNGYLSERMIEELKCRKDGAECVPLIKLLQANCGILCCAMCSCYNTVLGRDIDLPRQNMARNILWSSADNLHIIGVLDATSDSVDLKNDHRISLKADVAFFV